MKKANRIGAILSLVITAFIPFNTSASLYHFNDSKFAKEFTLGLYLDELASNTEFNDKYLILGETQKKPRAHDKFDLFSKHAQFVVNPNNQFLNSSGFSPNRNKTKFKRLIADETYILNHKRVDLSLHTLTNSTLYADADIGLSLSPADEIKGATNYNPTNKPQDLLNSSVAWLFAAGLMVMGLKSVGSRNQQSIATTSNTQVR